ncbi:MAG: N-formylglutamate amidohydrolase [Cyclobacteriaceae bacterium]
MTLISCEHAGNEVPADYSHLFENHRRVLGTHRGWDPGALPVALQLSLLTEAVLYVYTYTRLLVEPNRSLHHRNLFSFITQSLSSEDKESILKTYYRPYRNSVEKAIREGLNDGPVRHFSIHSFTPVWEGKSRKVEIGLLYDPASPLEADTCLKLKAYLQANSELCIRMNQPYRGAADGFTTYLRKQFPVNYAGIEIEVSQAIATSRAVEIASLLAAAIRQL